MSVFNNIKIELTIFIIVFLSTILFYDLDFKLHNYIQNLTAIDSNFYLKKFFIDITVIGSSLWYFSFSIIGFTILYISKRLNIINNNKSSKIIKFFISSFFYLLVVGLVTQIIKHFFGRPRPNYTNFENAFDFNFFSFESNFHSFPSGHSSTVFMVCFILCAALPKIRYFFYFLASVVALSRVVVGAHFFSDVIAGGILSLIIFKILNNLINTHKKNYKFGEILFLENSAVLYSIIFFSGCCLFLTIGPSMDIYISGLFYDSYSGFYLQGYDFLSRAFRDFFLPFLIVYILILPIVSLYIKIEKIYFDFKFTTKNIILIWTAQILTVVVFVNLILKNMWGRARPDDLFNFGGEKIFTPWYQLSNACDTNCSFVSGDSSVGFSIIILYFITKNIYFFYLAIVFGSVLGFIRIIAGGHFFSDILFSGLFVIIINFVIFKVYQKLYE